MNAPCLELPFSAQDWHAYDRPAQASPSPLAAPPPAPLSPQVASEGLSADVLPPESATPAPPL